MLDSIGELHLLRLCISELCRPVSGKEGPVQSKVAENPSANGVPDPGRSAAGLFTTAWLPHLKISRIADWNNGAVLACWQYLRFYDWVIFSLGYCGGYRRRELQAAPKVLNAAVRVKECGIHGANDCFFIPPDMSAPNLSSRFVMPIYTIDTEAGLVTALQSGATCGEDSPMILGQATSNPK